MSKVNNHSSVPTILIASASNDQALSKELHALNLHKMYNYALFKKVKICFLGISEQIPDSFLKFIDEINVYNSLEYNYYNVNINNNDSFVIDLVSSGNLYCLYRMLDPTVIIHCDALFAAYAYFATQHLHAPYYLLNKSVIDSDIQQNVFFKQKTHLHKWLESAKQKAANYTILDCLEALSEVSNSYTSIEELQRNLSTKIVTNKQLSVSQS